MKPIFLNTHGHDPAMIKWSTTNKLTIHLDPVYTDTQKFKHFVKAKGTEPNLPRWSSEDWPLPPVDSGGGDHSHFGVFFPSGLRPELRRNNEMDGGRGSCTKG